MHAHVHKHTHMHIYAHTHAQREREGGREEKESVRSKNYSRPSPRGATCQGSDHSGNRDLTMDPRQAAASHCRESSFNQELLHLHSGETLGCMWEGNRTEIPAYVHVLVSGQRPRPRISPGNHSNLNRVVCAYDMTKQHEVRYSCL